MFNLTKTFSPFRYEYIQRHVFNGGYMQQHIERGTKPTGQLTPNLRCDQSFWLRGSGVITLSNT
jgi:hypothetical protein